MCNKVITIWPMIILSVITLVSCQQEIENLKSPNLFVENISQNKHGQRSIYQISADGSHAEHIYDFGERDLYWFSPDFHYLAFTDSVPGSENAKPDLTLIDIRTNQVVTQISDITPYIRQNSVVWDPTGSKLLFDRTFSDRGSVDWWVYDIATGSQEILTTDTSIKLFPAWSTDGQYIAYVATPCPNHVADCNRIGDIWDITVVNVDTKAIRKVTDFADNSIALELGTGDELFCNLQWSFNNQHIAFENQCMRAGPIYERHRVFIVDITNETVQEALTFEQPYAYTYSYEWRESGDLLIGYTQTNLYDFQTFSRGGILSFDPLQSLDTRSAELLGFHGNEVRWSSNGKTFMVFTQEPIFTIPQNGQLPGSGATLLGDFQDGDLTIFPESTVLPNGLCQGNAAYWSADGQFVAFSSTGQQHVCNQDVSETDVFVYSVVNKATVNITESVDGRAKPIGWAASNEQP
ncbi:MAG TPA: hypothetical protein PLD25_32430 [Chloroflexota bacterium]|nr:hypothetical protein [Chloroflexota bacterium]HUM68129.1 hypothetical protein [Chloroflexota bacterium]